MTVPASKTSLVDPIVANDFNWPLVHVYQGSNAAFDSSPSDGQVEWRRDRGIDYYYNNSSGLWLSRESFTMPVLARDYPQPLSQAGHSADGLMPLHDIGTTNGVYLQYLYRAMFFNTAQSAVNYYSFTATVTKSDNTTVSLAAPSNTQAYTTGSRWYRILDTYNSTLSNLAYLFSVGMTANGAPGTFYFYGAVVYKLIG